MKPRSSGVVRSRCCLSSTLMRAPRALMRSMRWMPSNILAERQSSLVPRECAARTIDRNIDINLKCSRVRCYHHGGLARRVRRPTALSDHSNRRQLLDLMPRGCSPKHRPAYTNPDMSQGQPRRLARAQQMSATGCSTDGFVRRDVRGHRRVEGLNRWQIAVEPLYLHGSELSCASLRQ